jgi:hypothetical protein
MVKHLHALNVVHANEVIGETSKEMLTIAGPSKGDALNRDGLGFLVALLLEDNVFADNLAGLEVPDANGRGGGSAEPVAHRREDKGMDDVISRKAGQVATLVEVPEHGLTVLTTRSAERTIRGNGNGVNVVSVSGEVHAELAVGKFPDLDDLVPTSRDNERNVRVRGEADAADPLFVPVLGEGELKVTKSVPEVDGLVARSGDDLTVVGGEGDGENILGVANELAGAVTSAQFPQTESSIPRSGKSEVTIRREGNILDEVGMSGQSSERLSVLDIGSTVELPNDDAAVARSGDDLVGEALTGGVDSNGRDPATVSSKFTAKYKSDV